MAKCALLFFVGLNVFCAVVMGARVEQVTFLPRPFRVWASTFNAGNQVYQKTSPIIGGLVETVLQNHDQADLVLLGFQEFLDEGQEMGSDIRNKLWKPRGHSGDPGFAFEYHNSGTKCHKIAGHYDTLLYAYTNPKSEWTITPDPYVTAGDGRCKTQGSGGCTLINNLAKSMLKSECGKVVNLLRFRATNDDVTSVFCAMNTHLSFEAAATSRMENMNEAMDEAQKAGCQNVIFVGDFNSRMHCNKENGTVGGPVKSSFDELLEPFCTDLGRGDWKCALTGEKNDRDEMTQFLYRNEVDCGKTKASNILPRWGYKEADTPAWSPTYKYISRSKAKQLDDVTETANTNQRKYWSRCENKVDGLCLGNEDRNEKHNPAWTDRILVRGDHVTTSTYTCRMTEIVNPSDHLPVVAMVQFD